MSMSELLRGAMKRREPEKPARPDKTLDSVAQMTLDSAANWSVSDIRLAAIASIHQWVETDDLDDGESIADRLLALFVGVADSNKDGDINEEDQEVLDIAFNAAWDYLVKLGVTDEDAGALLNDWDEDVAERVRDLVASVLPEGDDEAGAAISGFVFAPEDQEPVLDAAYRKVVAVRNGKKVRINKRISGTVRLSPKVKLAIRKAQMKSHSAAAQARRKRSLRVRQRSGL